METTIFRMEDLDGKGPFSNGHIDRVENRLGIPGYHRDIEEHPNIYYDKIWYYGSNENIMKQFYCGCISIVQFLHWFPVEMLDLFEKEGSYVGVYKVYSEHSNLKVGSKQVMFKKSSANRVGRFKPNTDWKIIKTFDNIPFFSYK